MQRWLVGCVLCSWGGVGYEAEIGLIISTLSLTPWSLGRVGRSVGRWLLCCYNAFLCHSGHRRSRHRWWDITVPCWVSQQQPTANSHHHHRRDEEPQHHQPTSQQWQQSSSICQIKRLGICLRNLIWYKLWQCHLNDSPGGSVSVPEPAAGWIVDETVGANARPSL